HVGEEFLKDAKYHRGGFFAFTLSELSGHFATHANPSRKIICLPLDRLCQAKLIEHWRPQLRRNLPHNLERSANLLLHFIHLFQDRARGIGPQRLRYSTAEPGEVQAQQRQRLAKLIVNLARQGTSLLLAHSLVLQ